MSYSNTQNNQNHHPSKIWKLHTATDGYMNFYTQEFPGCPDILFDITSRAGDSSRISLVLTNTAFLQHRDDIVKLFNEHGFVLRLENRYGQEGGLGRILYQNGQLFADEINNVQDMENAFNQFHNQIKVVLSELRRYFQ